jgi:hypothetical protein
MVRSNPVFWLVEAPILIIKCIFSMTKIQHVDDYSTPPICFMVNLDCPPTQFIFCPIWSNLFHLVPTLKEIQKSKRHLKMMEKKISNTPSIPILFLASFGLNPQFAKSPVLIIFIGYHPAVRGTSRLAIYLMTPGGKLPLYPNKSSVYHIFSWLRYVKSQVLLVKSSFLLVN